MTPAPPIARIVFRRSPLTGTSHAIRIEASPNDWARWDERVAGGKQTAIQECFPNLSAPLREYIKTGYTAGDWVQMFGLCPRHDGPTEPDTCSEPGPGYGDREGGQDRDDFDTDQRPHPPLCICDGCESTRPHPNGCRCEEHEEDAPEHPADCRCDDCANHADHTHGCRCDDCNDDRETDAAIKADPDYQNGPSERQP